MRFLPEYVNFESTFQVAKPIFKIPYASVSPSKNSIKENAGFVSPKEDNFCCEQADKKVIKKMSDRRGKQYNSRFIGFSYNIIVILRKEKSIWI